MSNLKELQEQFGISAKNKSTESAERTSLDQIRKQVNEETEFDDTEECGVITDPVEIREIMDNIMWKKAKDCSIVKGWDNDFYSAFKSRLFTGYIDLYEDITLPPAESASLCDLFTVADYLATNYKGERWVPLVGTIERRELLPAQTLFSLFQNMGKTDPYFEKLRRVRVKDLVSFLNYKDGFYRDIPHICWGDDDSKPVYFFYDIATCGWLFDKIGECFYVWDPGMYNIYRYQEQHYYGCETMMSFLHSIVAGYCPDVKTRVDYLKECSKDENKLKELVNEQEFREKQLKALYPAV